MGYRNSPTGPRMLRPLMICPVGLWPPMAGGSDRSAASWTVAPAGPSGSRGGCRSAALRASGAADPGQLRACLTRPKSFMYHFAAEALLALI